MGLLDFIFPKYCINCKKLGDYLCPNCFSYLSFEVREICAVCNKLAVCGLTHPGCLGKYAIDGVFSSISYKGIAKKLIYQFKYKPHLSDLKKTLIDLFYEGLIQKEEFVKVLKSQPILVPVPLHSSKMRNRGYNQAEILAKGLGKKLGLEVYILLKRVKKTPAQVGLKREDRLKNLKGSFSMAPNILISQFPNIFLVDDVFTTGSTLLEAANVLKRNGAKKVFGLTLASQ